MTITGSSRTGSATLRRGLGRRLRQYREAAGKSAADVVEAKLASRAKLHRMETGTVPIRWQEMRTFGFLYRLTERQIEQLEEMAREAESSRGWSEAYEVPERLRLYAELQTIADHIDIYDSELIPGLLQSPPYSEAIIRHDRAFDEDQVRTRVNFRLERQKLVLSGSHVVQIRCIIGEAALRLVVGSSKVRADQIRHLIELNRRPDIDIVYRPFAAGPHSWMKGPFDSLTFPEEKDPPIAYWESHLEQHLTEEPRHVKAFRDAFTKLYREAQPIERYRP